MTAICVNCRYHHTKYDNIYGPSHICNEPRNIVVDLVTGQKMNLRSCAELRLRDKWADDEILCSPRGDWYSEK